MLPTGGAALPEVALSQAVGVTMENGKSGELRALLTLNTAKSFIKITGLIGVKLNVVRVLPKQQLSVPLKNKQSTENTWFNSKVFADLV